jgi:Immunity protein 42
VEIFGDKSQFAVSVEFLYKYEENSKTYGHFAFWANSQQIGNWDDVCDLTGVVHWCRQFVNTPVNRFEPTLALLSKEKVFATVYDPQMVYKVTNLAPSFVMPRPRTRFDISHLGMSSFNDFVAVLLLQTKTNDRLLWVDFDDKSIYEAILPLGIVSKTVVEFLEGFPVN